MSTRYPGLQALQSGLVQRSSAFADYRSRLQRFALLLAYQHRQCVLLAENASCTSVSLRVVLRFICTANRYNRVGEDHYNLQKMADILYVEPEQVYAAEPGRLEGREQVEDTWTGGTRLAARPARAGP